MGPKVPIPAVSWWRVAGEGGSRDQLLSTCDLSPTGLLHTPQQLRSIYSGDTSRLEPVLSWSQAPREIGTQRWQLHLHAHSFR